MGLAVKSGIERTVLDWTHEYLYPGLFPILQASRNIAGNVARTVKEVQGLHQMYKLWAEQRRTGDGIVDFPAIKRVIMVQKSHFEDDLEEHMMFLQAKCGGVDAKGKS